MGFYYFALGIIAANFIISWLNYRLMSRYTAVLGNRILRYGYYIVTITLMLILAYGWTRRPPFIIPEAESLRILIYVALDWLIGQLILLLFQPLLFLGQRLLQNRTFEPTAAAEPAPQQETAAGAVSRRAFLQGMVAATPILAFGISTNGIVEAQMTMAVRRHTLSILDLPSNLRGFTICQLSDTHLGPYFSLDKLDAVLQRVAQEQPDLLVITGDFIDDLSLLRPAMKRMNDLAARIPRGIYYCMGNHDYYRDERAVRAAFADSRVSQLDNSHALIVPGVRPFYLLGTDYPWAGAVRSGRNISDQVRQQCFAAANRGVPSDAFKVLMAHHSDCLLDGFAAGIPLTLTGHTHGGQIIVAGQSLLNPYRYMRGLYQENGVYGYVSSGTGHWLPVRFGCPPEIGVFVLTDE